MMTNGLTDEAIAAYAAQLLDLEADIEALQGDKKDVYANLRETYGKRTADSLKLAIKRHRMDADKRTEADEIDAEAERFLEIIRKPSAPRATRAREIIEEFDADTGEITETGIAVSTSSTAARKDVRGQMKPEGREPVSRQVALTAGTQAPPVETNPVPRHDVVEAGEGSTAESLPADIPEPALAPSEIAEPGDRSASTLAAATVVDRTKPNPICRDPSDCGIEASWNHTCLACLRIKSQSEAQVAVQ